MSRNNFSYHFNIVYFNLHTDPGEVISFDALLQTWPSLKHFQFIVGKTYSIQAQI